MYFKIRPPTTGTNFLQNSLGFFVTRRYISESLVQNMKLTMFKCFGGKVFRAEMAVSASIHEVYCPCGYLTGGANYCSLSSCNPTCTQFSVHLTTDKLKA